MSFFGPKYEPQKLKLNLKLVITRLQMLQKKNENQGLLARKEIAALLEKGKIDLARIKVEQVIRDDYMIEAMELMEMYANLLESRFGLIAVSKPCDEGIREAVMTLIWVTPRMEASIGEFKAISQYLTARYGKEFADLALENRDNKCVNERVIKKLSVHAPEARIVDGYLANIAQTYKINWCPPNAIDADMIGMGSAGHSIGSDAFPSPPGGKDFEARSFPAPTGAMYPPQQYQPAPSAYNPGPMNPYPPPSFNPQQGGYNPQQGGFPNVPPSAGFPNVPSSTGFPSSSGQASLQDPPDFDDLTRRFTNLKNGT